MHGALVGREGAVARGLDALERSGGLALVGPTGVGKTRLLSELVSQTEERGRPVFRAVATEATRTIPLSSFIRLLPSPTPQDPSLLLHAVLDQLARRRDGDGLLVAIDDAHHLDDGSLALLALLDRGSGIDLALTVSTDHPMPAGLRDVLDADRVVSHVVAPLDRPALDALVARLLGPADAELSGELWRLSEGNPLVARELLADAGDRCTIDDGVWRLRDPLVAGPGGARLRTLARARLGDLGSDLVDALVLVAVGAPVPYDLLATAISADLLRGLHDAELVETTPVGDDLVVRPAHPLYGEVFAAQAGETRRREAFRRLVDAAAARPGSADPLLVARWHSRSGVPADPAIALSGAQAALSRHDGATAERLVTPVLDDLGFVGLLTLGAALGQQGRPDEAEEALAAARPEEDGARVEVASVRAFNLVFGLGRVADGLAVLSDVAAGVTDGVLRGRLDAERGVIAGLDGDFGLALRASSATIANHDAPGPALASAYVSRSLAQAMLGHCASIDETGRDGLVAAGACPAEMPLARDQILIMVANAHVAAGRVQDAAALVVDRLGSPEASPLTANAWLSTLVIALTTAGDLDEALAASVKAEAHVRDFDPFRLAAQVEAMAGMVEGLRGDPRRRSALDAARLEHAEPRVAVWIDRARVWTAVADGDVDAAIRIAAEGGRAAIDGQHLIWGAMALHDAVRLGAADEVADDLVAVAERTEGAFLIEAMADHGRALVDDSADGLGDAVGSFVRCGAWLPAAEARAQQAGVLSRRGDAVGAARAAALSQLRELRCQGARSPVLLARPAPLSPRELQIAGDAASGHASSEIAERRFISVRTVDNHLGAIYRTLGLGGRDDLTDLLRPELR